MRYYIGYCVLGLHNATGVGSNPCQTTTACGALEGSILEEAQSGYSYCESGEKAIIPSDEFELCLSCVKTGGNHGYMRNCMDTRELATF